MIIKNLVSTSLKDITDCFNLSFSDYIIKFEVTENYLRERWHGAGVDMQYSVGVFDGDLLVGIIIHGIDEYKGKRSAYNVATGVIPSHRRQRLVQKMYGDVLPKLRQAGIEYCGLEVISSNEKAIKAYRNSGMSILRTLHCFNNKESTSQEINISGLEIKTTNKPNWPAYESFLDFLPSWENSSYDLDRMSDHYQYEELYFQNKLVGFAAIRPKTGYIAQFAVAPTHRRKGFGRYLFYQLSLQCPVLKINNVDGQFQTVKLFLEQMGFKNVIDQYEMGMDI